MKDYYSAFVYKPVELIVVSAKLTDVASSAVDGSVDKVTQISWSMSLSKTVSVEGNENDAAIIK